MRTYWEDFIRLLKNSKLFLALTTVMIISGSLSSAGFIFYRITNGGDLLNPEHVKLFLERKEIQAEAIERASRIGIKLSDNSSSNGINDIILLKGLNEAMSALPPQIFDFINKRIPTPLNIVTIDSFKEMQGAPSELKTHAGGGLYFTNANRIVVDEGRSTLTVEKRKKLFLHEIGHAFFASLYIMYDEAGNSGWYSGNWLIFIKEIENKEEAPSEYAKSNNLEDFAETFALYFSEPDYLREKSPLRYQKMEEILQQYNTKR